MIRLVALDADDTLWHNEPLFTDTQARFSALLSRHTDPEVIEQRLSETEIRNLQHYGYGVKAFTLSMVETAIELTGGKVTGEEVAEIVRMGREMLHAPVDLLDGVGEAVRELSESHDLMIVTKGDLLDQETKIERSGLRDRFRWVEVVSRKDALIYQRILARCAVNPDRFLMVGDSIRSDILPVLEIGSAAVHIPHDDPWQHEVVDVGEDLRGRYVELPSIRDLADAVRGGIGRGRDPSG